MKLQAATCTSVGSIYRIGETSRNSRQSSGHVSLCWGQMLLENPTSWTLYVSFREVASPGGGLNTAVTKRGGVSLVRCLYARQYSNVEFSVVIADDDGITQWEYTLAISQDNNKRPIVRAEIVKDKGEIVLERPDKDDNLDRDRLTQTALEQISETRRSAKWAISFAQFLTSTLSPKLYVILVAFLPHLSPMIRMEGIFFYVYGIHSPEYETRDCDTS